MSFIPGTDTTSPKIKVNINSIIKYNTSDEAEVFKKAGEYLNVLDRYMAIRCEQVVEERKNAEGKPIYTYEVFASRIGSAYGFSVMKTADSLSKAMIAAYEEAICLITGMRDGKVIRDKNGNPVKSALCDSSRPIAKWIGPLAIIKAQSRLAWLRQQNTGVVIKFNEYRDSDTGEYLGTLVQIRANGSNVDTIGNVFKIPGSKSLIAREHYYANWIINYLKKVPDLTPKSIMLDTTIVEKKSIIEYKKNVTEILDHQYIYIQGACAPRDYVEFIIKKQQIADKKAISSK
jgi:hypothetical protein